MEVPTTPSRPSHDLTFLLETDLSPFSGVPNGTLTPPPEFRGITSNSWSCVIAYTVLFFVAAGGNVPVFLSVCRSLRTSSTRKRLSLLILHLSVADLIVTFFLIPMEIFWRVSVEWVGGNFLCKACQFFRAFGLYLSSMVIICISLDRYFAVLHPLRVFAGRQTVKTMLLIAWITAGVSAAPQSLIFSVKSHPIYVEFEQCVAIGYFSSPEQEILYNVFSILTMYFAPLIVILYTYSAILWKITRKTREHQEILEIVSDSLRVRHGAGGSLMSHKQESHPSPDTSAHIVTIDPDPTRGPEAEPPVKRLLVLRRSDNGVSSIIRARNRTLRLTLLIVITFVLCASPYVFMTLWYMYDRGSAAKVNSRLQDAFFMMAVANSCLNPLIYGSYNKGCQRAFCGLSSLLSLCFGQRTGSKNRKSSTTPSVLTTTSRISADRTQASAFLEAAGQAEVKGFNSRLNFKGTMSKHKALSSTSYSALKKSLQVN